MLFTILNQKLPSLKIRWCKKFSWYARTDLQEESSKNHTDLIPMLYFIILHTTVNRMRDKIDHCVAGYGLWQLMLCALQPSCSDSRCTLRMTWWWTRLLYCAVTKGSTGNYREVSKHSCMQTLNWSASDDAILIHSIWVVELGSLLFWKMLNAICCYLEF